MEKDYSDKPTYAGNVSNVIEKALQLLNYDAENCRKSSNSWQVQHGSAVIEIVLHNKKGLIYADAILTKLPAENRMKLLEYLLKQNFYNQDLTLSIRDEFVILSFMTTDLNLNVIHLKMLLSKLLHASDKYDNILVEKFGASWIR